MADEISTLMSKNKSKDVLLRLRNNTTIHGILKEFDIHMNLTLDGAEDITNEKPVSIGTVLLRGDNILAISLAKEES